jgi:succinoglycan biosynthesis protein ExoO
MRIELDTGLARNRLQISFVVAAHDAAPWIEEALASALAQTGVTLEVVVIDDGSRDDTAARVAAMAQRDPRVRLLRRPVAGGPSAARNTGLAAACGDWIAILDADDLVAPERSERLLVLAERSGCAVVADNVLRFLDAQPQVAWPLLLPGDAPVTVDLAQYLRRNCMTSGDDNLGYLKPMFRRSFLEVHGIRYDERLRIGEDFNIGLRCLAAGTALAILPEPLYRYRMLASSLSRSLSEGDVATMLAAHADALEQAPPSAAVKAADAAYRRSVADMLAYVAFRDGTRAHAWGLSLRRGLDPRLWRALAAVGAGAIRRRRARRRALADAA